MKFNAQELRNKAIPRSPKEMEMEAFRRENRNWLRQTGIEIRMKAG